MLNQIVDIIDSNIDWISTKYGVVEHIEDNNKLKRPVKYIGNGEYKDVSFFDKNVSTSYWRVNGSVEQEKLSEINGCGKTFSRLYPLRMVIVAKRDDCTTVDEVFNKVIISLNGIENGIKNTIGLNKFSLEISSYIENREDIANEEYQKDFNYRYEYFVIAIEIKVLIHFNVSCLNDVCN